MEVRNFIHAIGHPVLAGVLGQVEHSTRASTVEPGRRNALISRVDLTESGPSASRVREVARIVLEVAPSAALVASNPSAAAFALPLTWVLGTYMPGVPTPITRSLAISRRHHHLAVDRAAHLALSPYVVSRAGEMAGAAYLGQMRYSPFVANPAAGQLGLYLGQQMVRMGQPSDHEEDMDPVRVHMQMRWRVLLGQIRIGCTALVYSQSPRLQGYLSNIASLAAAHPYVAAGVGLAALGTKYGRSIISSVARKTADALTWVPRPR